MLDIGQVLPFMRPQAGAQALLPEEAAWVCPVALRLVRFARSQGWTALAALIMPIASAGRLDHVASLPLVPILSKMQSMHVANTPPTPCRQD